MEKLRKIRKTGLLLFKFFPLITFFINKCSINPPNECTVYSTVIAPHLFAHACSRCHYGSSKRLLGVFKGNNLEIQALMCTLLWLKSVYNSIDDTDS